MDLEGITWSEISQKIPYDLTYKWNLKYLRSQIQRKDWWLLEAGGGESEWNEYISNFIKEEKKRKAGQCREEEKED